MMDPYTGNIYNNRAEAPINIRDRLVEVSGDKEDIYQMSRAISNYNDLIGPDKAKRRAASKAARKMRKRNRK